MAQRFKDIFNNEIAEGDIICQALTNNNIPSLKVYKVIKVTRTRLRCREVSGKNVNPKHYVHLVNTNNRALILQRGKDSADESKRIS